MNQTIATEPATLSQTLSEIGFEETKHATIEVLIQRKLLERIVNMHRSISEVRIRHSDEEGAHWHFFPVYQTVKTGAKKGKCLLVRSDLHLLRRNLELLLKY